MTKGYSEGKWSDLPNYQCDHCAYSTLKLDNMLEHIVKHAAPLSGLIGPDGAPLKKSKEIKIGSDSTNTNS